MLRRLSPVGFALLKLREGKAGTQKVELMNMKPDRFPLPHSSR